MKILTKEEEAEHYRATLTGGIGGGIIGTGLGFAGVYAASTRYPAFRSLTLPFRTFLVASTGTFASIVAADRYSRHYEAARHPETSYLDTSKRTQEELEASKTTLQRAGDWAKKNRYGIVFGSWIGAMAISLGLVGRNPYLTGSQKLVQARVYAQGLTVAVLVASFAFEANDRRQGTGYWETVKVLDPNDPTHKHMIEKRVHHERYPGEDQWRDMVEAEERRLKEKEEAVKHEKDEIHKIEKEHNKEHKKAKSSA